MKLYTSKTPSVFPKLFSKYRWHFHSDEKILYLTFDDGPIPEVTEFVLEQLKKYNAKGTFFCIGKNVKKNPDIYNRILSEGHVVGNHTHNHLKGWKVKTRKYLENIAKADQYIHSKLFRPPYGKIKKKQAKALLEQGYQIIMWDVLSADFDTEITPEKCWENVKMNAKKGSIIVFHDSLKARKNMEFALPKALEHFTKEGYSFKEIS
ncbi:polysaccharide deacetylase family protein [Flavobacteriaceae bacterium S356]|uniref:Polysaccharide deacetylase family protein n=1 Tax=Asprobacillus argus TaxID=3076534 RepID=A0ABU3LBT6_9FLAO|nr:polysaccharide deacetylase family protein [Flavobacteriaceae bacterium S356]